MKSGLLKEYIPLPTLEEQYSIEYMEKNRVVILKKELGKTIVGICNPDDIRVIEELSDFHVNDIELIQIQYDDFSSYLSRELSEQKKYQGISLQKDKIQLDKLADNAPIINLVNSLFIEAIRRKASDIHIEGYNNKTVIRYRIDGVMYSIDDYPTEYFAAISSRIKIMSNLNIMERRKPQDGRISVNLGNEELDMRLSIVPISGGESVVLRLFNKRDDSFHINDLGFSKETLEKLRQLYKHNHGLLLFTGPTGSGKTTSLTTIIRNLDSQSQKIITIEDPVEHILPGVSQIQTDESIDLTFYSILRRVLRQDPDIIMVGEIRDTETAQLAVRAALTGHLVLSSLHTNDSISTVQRLINMGVEPYLLGAVVRGIVAQRLVRKLCSHCSEKRELTPWERSLFNKYNIDSVFIYTPKGCERCNFSGYSGRTAVTEIFIPDETIEDMISKEKNSNEIISYMRNKGMKTLIEDALIKAKLGITSIEEIERVL